MTVRKGLGQANILRTNNNTSTGYGIVYADEVSGHRTVANLTALYALNDWQLSASGDNTNNDAMVTAVIISSKTGTRETMWQVGVLLTTLPRLNCKIR